MKIKNHKLFDIRFLSRILYPGYISLYFDFGSLYTRVATSEKILINQPTCYVSEKNSGTIVTIGKQALENFGKSSESTQIIFPIYRGTIFDLKKFEQYLDALLTQIKEQFSWKLLTKVGVVCYVPHSATSLDKQLFIEAFHNQGITQVKIEEKSKAILKSWANTQKNSSEKKNERNVADNSGQGVVAILDIGDQLSELVIGSLGEIILSTTIDFGGGQITQAIIEYLKTHHEIQISQSQAINIKHQILDTSEEKTIGFAGEKNNIPVAKGQKNSMINVRGVELSEGLVVTKKIQVESIKKVIVEQLAMLSKSFKKSLLRMNSQQLVLALENGLVLMGGGSLLAGIDDYLSEEMGLCVYKSPNPYSILGNN